MSQLTVFRNFDCRFCQFFHLYEPLVGYHIFDNRMASVAGSHRDYLFFGLNQITRSLKVRNPILTAFVAILTFIFSCQFVHRCVLVNAGNNRKSCALSYFKVVRVVRRSNFNGTGSLLRVRIAVRNNWDFLAYQWEDNLPADNFLISFIVRMNGDCFICEHGFRS